MILFSGWGFIVVPLAFISLMAATAITQALNVPDPAGMYCSFVLTAILIWIVGVKLNSRSKDRHLIDKETGKEFTLRSRHTLFFIPIQYYAFVIVAMLVVAIFSNTENPKVSENTIVGDNPASVTVQNLAQTISAGLRKITDSSDSPALAVPAAQASQIAAEPNDLAADGRITVVFHDVIPDTSYDGKVYRCLMRADIFNKTKYKLDGMSLRVGDDWDFQVGKVNANTHSKNEDLLRITLDDKDVCSYQEKYLIAQIKKGATVFDCSIPGLAEGDCQTLVTVDTNLNDASVNKLEAQEEGLNRKADDDKAAADAERQRKIDARRLQWDKILLGMRETSGTTGGDAIVIANADMDMLAPGRKNPTRTTIKACRLVWIVSPAMAQAHGTPFLKKLMTDTIQVSVDSGGSGPSIEVMHLHDLAPMIDGKETPVDCNEVFGTVELKDPDDTR